MTAKEIKKLAAQKGAFFGQNLEWINEVLAYLKINLLQLVSKISDTMRRDIVEVLKKAVSNGWSIDQTVEELKREDLAEARARTIARTETIRAANVGHSVGAKSLPYEVDKKWSAAEDERTRHSHRDVDGHQTSEYGAFKVPIYKGDELLGYDEMQFPGDPSAHASNTVNCRCRVLYIPKRDQQGKLILRSSTTATIIPMRSTNNTVTPAHQIAAALKAHIRFIIGEAGETE